MMKQIKVQKNILNHSLIDTEVTSMKVGEFVFDYVHLLYYKCHKINLNLGGSYIDSPDWIKKKKPTINPINKKDNKCFQYTATVAIMKTEDIKNDPQRVIKIKPFINRCNWQGINFPSQKEDRKTFQKNT